MKKAYLTYGRMNPPTRGHTHMANTMIERAREANATPILIVTHTRNNIKNPLTVAEKLNILREVYPSENVKKLATSKEHPSILKVIQNLKNQGFTNFTLVVGENRKNSFGYVPAKINWLSRPAGAISATMVRAAAVENRVANFKRMMPNLMNKTLNNTRGRIKTRIKRKTPPSNIQEPAPKKRRAKRVARK